MMSVYYMNQPYMQTNIGYFLLVMQQQNWNYLQLSYSLK